MIFAPRVREDFSSNATPTGWGGHGNAVTAANGYMQTASPDAGSDIMEYWTAGGNVTDTNRVTCSVTIDYTYDANARQLLALAYQYFSTMLAIGHDGTGKLGLWAADARPGNAPLHSVDMTGGKPAQGTKIWYRGTRQGNDVIVEEFREDPHLGGEPNTAFTFTLTGGAATDYGSGVNGYKAGTMMHGPSLATHYDDFLIEELIAERRTGVGRRVHDSADPGGGDPEPPAVPTTGRIWPRQR